MKKYKVFITILIILIFGIILVAGRIKKGKW